VRIAITLRVQRKDAGIGRMQLFRMDPPRHRCDEFGVEVEVRNEMRGSPNPSQPSPFGNRRVQGWNHEQLEESVMVKSGQELGNWIGEQDQVLGELRRAFVSAVMRDFWY
jgi:hypothetical protein